MCSFILICTYPVCLYWRLFWIILSTVICVVMRRLEVSLVICCPLHTFYSYVSVCLVHCMCNFFFNNLIKTFDEQNASMGKWLFSNRLTEAASVDEVGATEPVLVEYCTVLYRLVYSRTSLSQTRSCLTILSFITRSTLWGCTFNYCPICCLACPY